MNDMESLVAGQALWVFATYGQYLLPFACILAAIGSIASRARLKKLMTATQPGKAIDGLSWRQFGQLVGEVFRRQGYSITETGCNGPEGGVDLVLCKDGEKHLVQCKHWRSLKEGVAVIREFFGAMEWKALRVGLLSPPGDLLKKRRIFHRVAISS